MSKTFLGHKTYEELKELIGPIATAKLAKHYGGSAVYFPKVQPAADEAECTLLKLGWDGHYYAVEIEGRTVADAFFICRHCAEKWAAENSVDKHSIVAVKDITERIQASWPAL